jgi:rhamnosyltransferase
MGERGSVRVLGRRLGYNRHPPGRVYYMARNGTLLARRYARDQPRWVLRRLVEEGKAHTLRLALSPDRLTLGWAALAGTRDGLRGRTGPVKWVGRADRQRS